MKLQKKYCLQLANILFSLKLTNIVKIFKQHFWNVSL